MRRRSMRKKKFVPEGPCLFFGMVISTSSWFTFDRAQRQENASCELKSARLRAGCHIALLA